MFIVSIISTAIKKYIPFDFAFYIVEKRELSLPKN